MSKCIAIIGGGISGCVTALKLLEKYKSKVNIVLYEKRDKLLGGPPFCHLHAGGMLYPMISIKECESLLHHSILFAQEFSECITYIPTVVAYRKNSKFDANKLVMKCRIMKYHYASNVAHPLGDPETYYQVYDRQDIIALKNGEQINKSEYHDKYVREFAKILDNIDDIKYPFVSVREHSISMEKIKRTIMKRLYSYNNIEILYNTTVESDSNGNGNGDYDYIINAAGCNIDDLRKEKSNHYLEFKASWMIHNRLNMELPEIAIIGERDTENGMIQISPLSDGLYQIHCMMDNVTLFDGGLIYNKKLSDYPDKLKRIIDQDKFDDKTTIIRTTNAIKEISKVFSVFNTSTVSDVSRQGTSTVSRQGTSEPLLDGSVPKMSLWGVQRIVGNDKTSRSNDIMVDGTYIEIHIVKGISSVYAANKILKNVSLGN
jgi:hypothetical protein